MSRVVHAAARGGIVEMHRELLEERQTFRLLLDHACHEVFDELQVTLHCRLSNTSYWHPACDLKDAH